MKRLAVIGAILLTVAEAAAPAFADSHDRLVPLGSRIFDFGERTETLNSQVSEGFVRLNSIDWINGIMLSDPYLRRMVINVFDESDSWGDPVWWPDRSDHVQPDPTLPQVFAIEGYDVGWFHEFIPEARGTVMLRPIRDADRFYVTCAFDREDPGPGFCGLQQRYQKDQDLRIEAKLFRAGVKVTQLEDFEEIAYRVEALIRCLDVTEAVAASIETPTEGNVEPGDLAPGGRCRTTPSS